MTNINDSYLRDLDLNLLRVFVVVAEERSLTRAAARLYVTQPAVSASIRRLTDFIGAELFTRQGHGVVLTTRGADLLATAQEHLRPLVAAAAAVPAFDPALSAATARIGLADCLEAVLLPKVLARLRTEAPSMRLVVLTAQFRNVEEALLTQRMDLAVTVADELPRSILRRRIGPKIAPDFVCLFDPRHVKIARAFSERDYFNRRHIAVSYAGDTRGIIEDALGKTRDVCVSVPAFGHVPDLVDGADLVATIPELYARHILALRPHLAIRPLPFALQKADLEMLWSRVTDNDAALSFVRTLIADVAATLPQRALAASKKGR